MVRKSLIEKLFSKEFLLPHQEKEMRRLLEISAELGTQEILETIVSRIDTDPQSFALSLSSNTKKNLRTHQNIIQDRHELPYLSIERQSATHHATLLEQKKVYALDNTKNFTSDLYAHTYAQRYQATLPTESWTMFDTTQKQLQPIHFSLSCLHDVTTTSSNLRLLFVQDPEKITSMRQLMHSFGPHRMNDFRLRFRPYSGAIEMASSEQPLVYHYFGPLETSDQTIHQLFLNYSEVHHHPDKARIQFGEHAQESYGLQPQVASGIR